MTSPYRTLAGAVLALLGTAGVVALVGYEVSGRYLPSLRRPANWLQAGRVTSGTWAVILGVAVISGVALVA